MEASALQAPATLTQTRVALGTPLLRFRSDEQLVALFRAGHDEAFRAIHDRYHKRLFAYARQMLPARQDAEDALQDVFVRAYAGLRASNQDLALRAWLFRVAHNRCIDELRRPAPPAPELLQLVRCAVHDPLVEVDLRESLRRLIEDIRRLPEQQRSALLMRELTGMSYADLSASLGISVGAVKSLLVRARVALAQAAEARDTSCLLIREQLVEAHDRGVRPGATARKHMRDCVGCKSFRRELRGMSRQLAAVSPAAGPLGVLAKTLGFSGGGGGGIALLGGGGAAASGGLAVGVNHVATLLVAAVAATGGAVELQHTIGAPPHHPAAPAAAAGHRHHAAAASAAAQPTAIQAIARDVEATVSTAPKLAASAATPALSHPQVKLRRKMTSDIAFGGPVSGASGLSEPSTTTGGTSTPSATGTTERSNPSSSCPAVVTSATSGTSAPTPQSPAAGGTQASAVKGPASAAVKSPASPAVKGPASAISQTPCATTSTPSTGTSGGSTSTTPTGSGQSTSGTTSGTTTTGGPTSTGGSGSSSSSGTPPSSGGSPSTGT